MIQSIARIDLWGKGHRVTRTSEEIQRLAPPKRAELPSLLEATVDRFGCWPALLDSLHKGAPKSLLEQFCVLITEHQAAVAVPHATRDAHDRPSILIVVAYVDVDWKVHDELVKRICSARALCVRLGSDVAEQLAGADQGVSDQLRKGSFLQVGYDLDLEKADDQPFWEELMGGVARFRGITGIATPRMFAFGANVIVGTRAEAERAGADGFFDKRTRQLVSIGDRLVTWQSDEPSSPAAVQPRTPDPTDVVTHVLEVRDRLEHVEATVDRIAFRLEDNTGSKANEARKSDELRKEAAEANRRIEARMEEMDRRAEQFRGEWRRWGEHLLEMVDATYKVIRRFLP